MNGGVISKRYAKALLLFATDRKTEDTVFGEMKKLAATYAGEPGLHVAMDNPTLNKKEKLKLIIAAVGGKASEEFVKFSELIVKNKRENHLQTIALSYIDLYCELKKITRGKLITAAPVSKATLEKIEKLSRTIKDGTLDLETQVDPRIDGGFVLYIDTYRLDACLKSQLEHIKNELIIKNS